MNDEPIFNVSLVDQNLVTVYYFECICEKVLVCSDPDKDLDVPLTLSLEVHGCGRPELERIDCEQCERVWRIRNPSPYFEEAD